MRLPLHDPLLWARYTFAHDGEADSERFGDLADQLDDGFGDLDDRDADSRASRWSSMSARR
jgi:hypothetical protein